MNNKRICLVTSGHPPMDDRIFWKFSKSLSEAGYSVTYASITEDSYTNFLGIVSTEHRSDNVVVSYLPIGFRLKPKLNGFMLKLNIGPVFNYSAPNVFSDNSTEIWGGLAVGYSFY